MPRGPSVPTRKVELINQLTHTKGPFAGQPFNLRRWQERDIIRPLFTLDPTTGRRRYRTCLLMMPRKNGKTELCAALAIDGLLFDGEMGAEVYSAANDRDQASLCFNVAAQMIRNDAELLAACDIVDSQKRIVHRKSGSVYRAISAESFTKHGINASRVIYDELHAAPTRDLWDVLATSTGARAQPLVIAISTAGYDRHSILWELYQHGKTGARDPGDRPDVPAGDLRSARRGRLDGRGRVAEGQSRPGRFPVARGAAHGLRPRAGDPRPGERVPPALPQPVDRAGQPVADAWPPGTPARPHRTSRRWPGAAATSASICRPRPT